MYEKGPQSVSFIERNFSRCPSFRVSIMGVSTEHYITISG